MTSDERWVNNDMVKSTSQSPTSLYVFSNFHLIYDIFFLLCCDPFIVGNHERDSQSSQDKEDADRELLEALR